MVLNVWLKILPMFSDFRKPCEFSVWGRIDESYI
jgi:hypothetical protein